MNIIKNQSFDAERSLYNLKDTLVEECHFGGPADGESAFKEARNITLKNCDFSMRYPLWHCHNYKLEDVKMDELTRAAVWYSYNGTYKNCELNGIKALRECEGASFENCSVVSPEFGWRSKDIVIKDCRMQSEYYLFESRNIKIDNLKMKGKYSFQYVENMTIENSDLDTKDAFWHGKNITVKNSTIKGEYLAWFSDNLTLINCHISGTQPLCYCTNLKLINCTMENADFAFEYSDVEADIKGNIISVKNPKSGLIVADSVGEIIWEDPVMEVTGRVEIRK